MTFVQRIREERGSALIMVLFIFLLFTILGTAVLSATIGGAQRTATRESDVQSLHLTEKSLDEAAAYITSELNGWKDIDPSQIENKIKSYVTELNASSKLRSVNTGLSSSNANGGITDITYVNMNNDEENKTINYNITITAETEVNGVKRKMKREIKIDTYPDFLKYALGSGKDLIINGAAAITGNIYAGDKLIIRNRAEYVFNHKALFQKTLYPELTEDYHEQPQDYHEQPEDKEYGEAHVQSLEQVYFSDGSSTGEDKPVKDKNVDTPEEANKLSEIFNNILGIKLDNVKIKNNSKFVQINIDESFVDKVAEAAGAPASARPTIRENFSGNGESLIEWVGKVSHYATAFQQLEKPVKPIEPIEPGYPAIETDVTLKDYNEQLKIYDDLLQMYKDDLNRYKAELGKVLNRSETAIYNGDLLLDNLEYKGLTFTKEAKETSKWFIVKGDLTIDNYEELAIQIRGNILVTGNVKITGNVDFDSTIFVLGNTKVQDAKISGLEGKELVLISKGSILINRYDKFSDTTTALNGFFYTDGSAELYGVGSIFRLRGGFFANGGMTINAVLGKAQGSQSDITFSEPEDSGRKLSRFEVIYNPDVYTHQKAGLPRVQQVNVTVGPIQLINVK